MVDPKHTMRGERWQPVLGLKGLYEVSSHGRIRGLDRHDSRGHRVRGRVLKIRPFSNGYPIAFLKDANGNRHIRAVHAIVATAFLGASPGKVGHGSLDYQCNHKNGIKHDNRVSNLEWVTHAGNHRHAAETGLAARGEALNAGSLTDERVRTLRWLRSLGFSVTEAAKRIGVPMQTAWHAIRGHTWKHVR